MMIDHAALDAKRAVLEADLRVETRRASCWIAACVFFFGVNVFLAAYCIIVPGGTLWLQTVAVTVNVASAVYGWHVTMNLARLRAEWLTMLNLLRSR